MAPLGLACASTSGGSREPTRPTHSEPAAPPAALPPRPAEAPGPNSTEASEDASGGLGLSGTLTGREVPAGYLPRDVIQKVVRDNHGAFRKCYEGGLQRDATLEGLVLVRFVIDPEGRVSDATLDDRTTMPDGAVNTCMLQHYQTLVFPKPTGGGSVVVAYPIRFLPSDPSSP